MDTHVAYTLAAVFSVSAISLIGVFFISLGARRMRSFLLLFVGVAVGALLGDALLHLFPESIEGLGVERAALWTLIGIFVFFILEKVLHWRHSHAVHNGDTDTECTECDEHIEPFGILTIISDALHNIIDGIIIAASFLVSVEVGVATTIAVALHEIPQEISDFGVLLHAGFDKLKALLLNFASALSAFIGAGLVLLIHSSIEKSIPVLSALAAGSFIYIAMADLIPELHKTTRVKRSLIQFVFVIAGIGIMFALKNFE